jgi:hypothetical protein
MTAEAFTATPSSDAIREQLQALTTEFNAADDPDERCEPIRRIRRLRALLARQEAGRG